MWALEQLLIFLKVYILQGGENRFLRTERGCATAAGRFDSGRQHQAEDVIQVVPVEGQPPKWRDGFRIVRLVISIILTQKREPFPIDGQGFIRR